MHNHNDDVHENADKSIIAGYDYDASKYDFRLQRRLRA